MATKVEVIAKATAIVKLEPIPDKVGPIKFVLIWYM